MGLELKQFITNVLAMPHYSNDRAGSGEKFNSHEDALSNELIKVGYTEINQTGSRINRNGKKVRALTYPNLKSKAFKRAMSSDNRQDEIAALVPGMENGRFIRQPLGSQSFPDFLIRDFSGAFAIIEAKSTQSSTPAWNDSLVKRDAIYIFSSGKHNQSTVFLGHDVLDTAREQYLWNQYLKIKEIVEQTQTELEQMPDPFNRGFTLSYARPKFEQLGGQAKIDYFSHKDRKTCEENVLYFAEKQ
jgi:hypothetical protein